MIRSTFAAAALAVAAFAAVPAIAQPTPPPIEADASLPALSNVMISPDGGKIAYIRQAADGRQLVVMRLTGEVISATSVGDQKVRGLSWADDRHLLITTSEYTEITFLAREGEYYNAQIYDVEDGRFTTILEESRGGAGARSMQVGGGAGFVNIVLGAPFVRVVNGEPRVFARS